MIERFRDNNKGTWQRAFNGQSMGLKPQQDDLRHAFLVCSPNLDFSGQGIGNGLPQTGRSEVTCMACLLQGSTTSAFLSLRSRRFLNAEGLIPIRAGGDSERISKDPFSLRPNATSKTDVRGAQPAPHIPSRRGAIRRYLIQAFLALPFYVSGRQLCDSGAKPPDLSVLFVEKRWVHGAGESPCTENIA